MTAESIAANQQGASSAAGRKATLILNGRAGTTKEARLRETLLEGLATAGFLPELLELTGKEDFSARCDAAVRQAVKDSALAVAAGGDGTVNSVAALCHRYGATLGVIPLGTFNYFARELGIPTDPAGALEALARGTPRMVSLGFVQEHLFLNNASFGLYTRIIRQREEATSRFGRLRFVAAVAAAKSLLQRHKRFAIKIVSGEEEIFRKTSMVFVGNNTLQLEKLGLNVARGTQADQLAVVFLKRMRWFETVRFLWRGVVKNLHKEETLEEFCADSFQVESKRRRIELVIDGEIIQCATPLSFRVEKDALSVLAPPAPEAT